MATTNKEDSIIRKRKVYALTALILPTTTSIILAVLPTFYQGFNPPLISWIIKNRGTVQIIVQMISTALGALQLYAISGVLNFRVNLQVISSYMSLDKLKLYNSAISETLDLDLPTSSIAILLVYLVLAKLSTALWAGALTPIVTVSQLKGGIQIPAYSISTKHLWGELCVPGGPCDQALIGNSSDLGTFTYLPWKYKPGLLLESVKQASSQKSSTSRSIKSDNTGFAFNGRSFGVASTIGLVNVQISSRYSSTSDKVSLIQHFSYFEPGYIFDITCDYNQTNDLKFHPVASWAEGSFPWQAVGFIANGSLPNGNWTGFPTWGVSDNSTLVAISAVAAEGKYMYGFAAGSHYASLNMVQCEVLFNPAIFKVAVDMISKDITVTEATMEETGLPWGASALNIDPSYALAVNTFFGPSFLSATLTSGYTSVLGKAFNDNTGSLLARRNNSDLYPATVLRAVGDGLEILIDLTLGSLGAAQMMLNNDTQRTEVHVTASILRIGERIYVYSALGISVTIALGIAAMALWTHSWHGLPMINVLDFKSAILGIGREETAVQIVENWDGNAQDRTVGQLKVTMDTGRKKLILTA